MYGDIRSVPTPPPASKATGRQILSASWRMLRADQQLLWLPIIGVAASVAAMATLFLVGLFAVGAATHNETAEVIAGAVVGVFAATVVGIYFQAALVVGAYQRADGQRPTVGGVFWLPLGSCVVRCSAGRYCRAPSAWRSER